LVGSDREREIERGRGSSGRDSATQRQIERWR